MSRQTSPDKWFDMWMDGRITYKEFVSQKDREKFVRDFVSEKELFDIFAEGVLIKLFRRAWGIDERRP
jgi:hypothetical protein